MPNVPLGRQGRDVAAEIIHLLERANLPRGMSLNALAYCRSQLESRTLVETAVMVAGCSASGFLWNDELELYVDIAKNGEDVAFISKGWGDPGLRIGELVHVPLDQVAQLEKAKQFCDANGVVFSVRKDVASGAEVMLEQVIYSTSFDGRTFALALSTLIKCSDHIKRC